ncbi:MAG: hypothetical protein HQ557_19600 [Bacteroidetes bacterium]|nr:hypothetical protein [Bacteroidota bacterium]
MKINKVKIVGILLLVALFAFSGCSLIFNENADADLSELAAFASGLDTAMRLIAIDADVAVVTASRTVNPGSYNGGAIVIGATPDDTYPGESSLVNFPNDSSYIQNFYGNPSLTAKFSMKPVSGYYEIKLFVYDAADFLLDFVYEEYYVAGDGWAPLKANGTTPGYIDYYDNMHDGSKVQHTEYEFGPVSGNVYDIAVPESIPDNLANYTFTIRSDKTTPSLFDSQTIITTPSRGVAGDFDSYKKSTGNYKIEAVSRKAPSRPDFESITYYSELNSQQTRNMVVFSLQEVDKEKNSYARVVTRSHEEYSGLPLVLDTKELHSLITIAEKGKNPWQYIAKDIVQTVNGSGLTVVDHTEGVYYEGSTVDRNPDKRTHMELTQVPASVNDFSGTMSVFWKSSSKTDNYTVTYNGTKFKTKKSGSRAVSILCSRQL